MTFLILRASICGLVAVATIASAEVVEEVVSVPVVVHDVSGRVVSQDIVVTVLRDTTRERAPLLVLSHGRGANRTTMSRVRYPQVAPFFVAAGYLVVMPTRIGYGPSGGPDVETKGRDCEHANPGPGFAVAADETQQVIDWASRRADVDPTHIVAVGMSYGGATTLALAARNPPGLVAAINFSGGSGGDVAHRPEDPCNPQRVAAAYSAYGATTHVPELWLYSVNDKLWGSEIPKQWFAAFHANGAPARFIETAAVGGNGHTLMTNGIDQWREAVLQFLADPIVGARPRDEPQAASNSANRSCVSASSCDGT